MTRPVMNILPHTRWGWASLVLIVLTPVLFFIGSSMTDSLYAGVPSGDSIGADILARPALALTMLAGILAGGAAMVTGVVAMVKKERALLVYLSTAAGALLLVFVLLQVIFPA